MCVSAVFVLQLCIDLLGRLHWVSESFLQQTCVSANRFLVQEGIYDQFVATFVKSIQQHLKVGDNPQATVGPLINHKAVEKVERHIADAVKKGGKVHLGGKRHSLGGNFFEPTVLTHVQTDMLVCQEETFGPVVSIVKLVMLVSYCAYASLTY